MRYRTLADTGLQVSQVGLGTMTFGDQLSQQQADRTVAIALDHGINFFDTADIYFPGHPGVSETVLGKALGENRSRVILAGKCGGAMSADPNDRGLSRRHVIQAVEASLKRLGTDYLDILYYHFPDSGVSLESLVFTANDLIRAGKIRHYGVSNFAAWQTCALYLTAQSLHLIPPAVTQDVYNLLTRGVEEELIPMCRWCRMGLVVYNPLAGGLLTGKYTGAPAPGTRFHRDPGYARRYYHPNTQAAVDQLSAIAASWGGSVLALSLQWLLQSPHVTAVLLGVSRPEQLEQNLALAEQPLPGPLPQEAVDQVWTQLKGNLFSYHR